MIKRSVSVAVFDSAGRVLLVQRPADDEDLPNAWGLPAASLQPGESWEAAVVRAGRDKLGVEMTVGTELRSGELKRDDYVLEMKLFQAHTSDEPRVPQSVPGVTQYQDWKWGSAPDLEPAA